MLLGLRDVVDLESSAAVLYPVFYWNKPQSHNLTLITFLERMVDVTKIDWFIILTVLGFILDRGISRDQNVDV